MTGFNGAQIGGCDYKLPFFLAVFFFEQNRGIEESRKKRFGEATNQDCWTWGVLPQWTKGEDERFITVNGGNQKQMYGKFQEFPERWCIVWVGVI